MNEFLWGGDELMERAQKVTQQLSQGKTTS